VRVPTIRALVDSLFETKCRDELLFGMFLFEKARRAVATLSWSKVAGWLDSVDTWETCDQLAMIVAAPIVADHPEHIQRLLRLTTSVNAWHRRFALATASALNQKGPRHAGSGARPRYSPP
jgi:3-methyladenine DNA glycosylase AlkD